MANGSPRLNVWKSLDVPTKVDLVINDLDVFDQRQRELVASIDARLGKIERRSQWILVTFVGLLMAVLGNLILILLTR